MKIQAPAGGSVCPTKQTADLEKARAACKDFESILLYQMLSSMRKAFESDEDQSPGLGGDIYKSMIDEQLSVALSKAGGIGLSKLLEQGLGLKGAASAPALPVGETPTSLKMPSAEPKLAPADLEKPASVRPAVSVPASGPQKEGSGDQAKPRVETTARAPVRIDELVDSKGASSGAGAQALSAYESTIKAASKVFGLSADLIKAVILHESGGDTYAVSAKGAKGLMQLTDATARTLGVTNPFNPVQNIFAGARHLGSLVKMFEGDLKLALASYNAGSEAVRKYGGVPPYKETQEYVKKVMASFERLRQDAEGTDNVYQS